MQSDRMLTFVNPVLFLAVGLQLCTGIAMGLFHSHLAHGVHGVNGYVVLAVVATHITLNRGWIGRTYFGRG